MRLLALARRYDPARWRDDPILAQVQAQVSTLEAKDLRSLSWAELLDTARQAMGVPYGVVELRRRYLPRTLLALGALRLLLGRIGRADHFGALLSGVENQTLAANRALEALAADIRGNPDLAAAFAKHSPADLQEVLASTPTGREFLAALDQFVVTYGHRETATPLLVSQPTWKDAPEVVLGILQGLARGEPSTDVDQRRWQAARDEVLAHPLFRLPPLRRAFLRLLTEARRFPSLREDTHFLITLPMPILRRTLLEMGRRLTEVGGLDAAADVFHLRFDELERLSGAWPPAPHRLAELRAAALGRAQRRAELGEGPLIDLHI